MLILRHEQPMLSVMSGLESSVRLGEFSFCGCLGVVQSRVGLRGSQAWPIALWGMAPAGFCTCERFSMQWFVALLNVADWCASVLTLYSQGE